MRPCWPPGAPLGRQRPAVERGADKVFSRLGESALGELDDQRALGGLCEVARVVRLKLELVRDEVELEQPLRGQAPREVRLVEGEGLAVLGTWSKS